MRKCISAGTLRVELMNRRAQQKMDQSRERKVQMAENDYVNYQQWTDLAMRL